MRHLALALTVLIVTAPSATAAPGELDPSFSSDGRVTTLGTSQTFVPRALAVQADGRIVVAGYSCDTGTCGPTGDSSFRLTRYTADGGLDTDFGSGGTVTTAVGAGRSQAYDVVLEPDGSIVAGGVASADGSDPGSFALVRYRPNGALDPSFGSGGEVITRIGNGFDAISDLVVTPGGGLAAIGQAEQSGATRFALARFDAAGALDPDSAAGAPSLAASGSYAFGAAGAVLPDGRIVAVGASGASSDVSDFRFTTVRSGPQGTLEPARMAPIGNSYSFANAAAALGDGRVLSAGVATDAGGRAGMALVRLTAAGRPRPELGWRRRRWRGSGTAPSQQTSSCSPTGARSRPGTSRTWTGCRSWSPASCRTAASMAPSGRAASRSRRSPARPWRGPPRSPASPTAAYWPRGSCARAAAVPSATAGPPDSRSPATSATRRPHPRPASPAPAVTPTFVGLPSVLRARHGRVRVRVRCLQSRTCRGTLSLRRLRSRGRTLLLASRKVTVRARRATTFTLKLRRGLGRSKRIKARVYFHGRDASGRLRTVTRAAQLRQ